MGWLSKGLGFVGGAIGSLFGGAGSSIGSSIGSGIGDFISGSGNGKSSELGNILSFGNSALGLFNDVTGRDARQALNAQKDLMAYQAALQNYYWRDQYGSRHQLEVSDLKKAGLNPILSTHSAGGVAGVSASASPNETKSQRKIAQAQINQLLVQQQLANSQSAKNLQEAEYARIRGLNDSLRTKAEINLMKNQGLYYQANSNYLNNEALQWAKTSLPGAGLGLALRFGPRIANTAKSVIFNAGRALSHRSGKWTKHVDRHGRSYWVDRDSGQLLSGSPSY